MQRQASGESSNILDAAAAGVADGGGALPHQAAIQQSFGGHDVGSVSAHVGGDATAACADIGASAYATGNDVAFAGAPSLHTAAHEAAHVVQQRAGVQLRGGVGQVGDVYEANADAVADAVVAGRSAEALLGQTAGAGTSVQRQAVQRTALPAGQVVQLEGDDEPSLLDRARAALAPIGDAIGDVVDAVTGTAQTAEQRLREAVGQGAEALERTIRDMSVEDLTAALPSVREVAQYIIDTYWPTNTGWTGAAALTGGGTIAGSDLGIPFDVELELGTGVSASVFRKGAVLELGVSATGTSQAAGVPTVKALELPLGIRIEGVEAFTLKTDLARITWPRQALQRLLAGDTRGCFRSLFTTALSLDANTQIERKFAGNVSEYVTGRAGLNSVVQAGLTAGARAGLEVTVANPTESMDGKVEFKGEVGLFGSAQLNFAEGFSAVPGAIQPLVAALLHTSVRQEAAGGLRVTYTIPKTEPGAGPATAAGVEVAVFGRGRTAGSILGQDAEIQALAEVVLALPDIRGFVAALESPDGADADDVAGLIPFSRLVGEITGKMRITDLVGIFPRLARVFSSLEDANTLEVSFKLKLEITKAAMMTIAERITGGIGDTVTKLLQGDIRGAIANNVDVATETLADYVGMVKGLEAEVQTGTVRTINGETPGEGDISGVSGSATGSIMAVSKYEWTPQQLGLDRVQRFLRGVI